VFDCEIFQNSETVLMTHCVFDGKFVSIMHSILCGGAIHNIKSAEIFEKETARCFPIMLS
jgi:hypothetical protein